MHPNKPPHKLPIPPHLPNLRPRRRRLSRVEVRVDVFEDGGFFEKGGRGSGGMGGWWLCLWGGGAGVRGGVGLGGVGWWVGGVGVEVLSRGWS
jgi:hypothetical protein